MGTQGIVSVVKDGEMLVKAVAGCDGYNAHALAQEIADCGMNTVEEVFSAAQRLHFGSRESLVVQDSARDLYAGDDELSSLYREKFKDPEFNPRWELGSADHVVVVDLSDFEFPSVRDVCCHVLADVDDNAA